MTTTAYPFETNNLRDAGLDHSDTVDTLDWDDPALCAIIRIRLLDPRQALPAPSR